MDSEEIVFVIDDDDAIRESLSRFLSSEGFAVQTFASAEEFLNMEIYRGVGCVILDIHMPGLSGMQLQDRLKNSGNNLPIVFVTGHGTIPRSAQAFKAGAVDFLEKPFEDTDLLKAVSCGIEKHRRLRQAQDELSVLRSRLDTLTPREQEVFRLLATGMLNKQMAFDMGITVRTIKAHRGQVMEKMGAQSIVDIALFARKLGIVPGPAIAPGEPQSKP